MSQADDSIIPIAVQSTKSHWKNTADRQESQCMEHRKQTLTVSFKKWLRKKAQLNTKNPVYTYKPMCFCTAVYALLTSITGSVCCNGIYWKISSDVTGWNNGHMYSVASHFSTQWIKESLHCMLWRSICNIPNNYLLSSWNCDVISNIQLLQSTCIYLKNIRVKFHPDLIWNDSIRLHSHWHEYRLRVIYEWSVHGHSYKQTLVIQLPLTGLPVVLKFLKFHRCPEIVLKSATVLKFYSFGQNVLIWTLIFKFVATRWHLLRLKCTKFEFGWGSIPDPAEGAYSAPPGRPRLIWIVESLNVNWTCL